MPASRASRPGRLHALRDRMHAFRDRVHSTRGGRQAWRIAVGLLGLAIVVVGVLLLPLPGPGWLIIFGGLGVWATEFEWAHRLLMFARAKVGAWTRWTMRQSAPVRGLLGACFLAFAAGVGWLTWQITF